MNTEKTMLSVNLLLTIPQAAKRLTITQRRLRALLKRPEYAARTRMMTQRTHSGVVWSAPGLPPDLIADLNTALNPVGVALPESKTGPPADHRPPEYGEPGTLPAIVYQKLLEEKDGRIADLKAENQKLHAALLLSQNNLARQQVLRALPEPSDPAPPTPALPAPRANGHPRGFWGRLRRLLADEEA